MGSIDMSFVNDDRLQGFELHQDEVRLIESRLFLYGNVFVELIVEHGEVTGLNFLDHTTMRRQEGPDGRLTGFTQTLLGTDTIEFEPSEIIHWRAGA